MHACTRDIFDWSEEIFYLEYGFLASDFTEIQNILTMCKIKNKKLRKMTQMCEYLTA